MSWLVLTAGRARELAGKLRLDNVTLASLVMALAMWLTMALAEPRNSPTSDEYWHLTRGVAALRAPDTRLNLPHPPFAQALAALPVSLTSDPKLETRKGWATGSMPLVSSAFIKGDYARGRRYLHQARLMNAALGASLLVFLVAWLRQRWGARAALAVGVFYGTCPIVLAHAGLITNDFGLGAATILGFAGIYEYLERGGWKRLLLAAAGAALLPITKVSGLLIFAMLAIMPLFWLARRSGTYAGGTFGRAAVRLLRDYAVVAAVTLFAINAVYRFNNTGLTIEELSRVAYPTWHPPGGKLATYTLLKHWPSSWPVPLPFTYLECIEFVNYKNQSGHSSMWFGKYTRSGAALYFPFMLLGKTQALLLPVILLGFVLGPRKMWSGPGKWLLLLALGFLGGAMQSKINIGVRHVFPTLICLLVLGGRGADVLLGFVQARLPRAMLPTAGVGAAALYGGVLMAFPAYVGDFNVLVGNELGRSANPVAEDWGQDGAGLARELKRRGLASVAYAKRHSYGGFDLENEGIRVRNLSCRGKSRGMDAVAIHLTSWARKRKCYKALRRREPDFVVNHNVLVFLTKTDDASAPSKRAKKRRAKSPEPEPEPESEQSSDPEATGGSGG
jgi:hypothetical protein